ncbi:hypothetical protein BDN72DRAFT_831429 [Pluteus cervinus]|uniref:Uncharacterized protein n=1 Tax=Pluteus cervinus TaxID=181527 RepID=A0ACD3BDP8_9AGAR|nr:hypothetical protein BDN72DRAFT_831429 [Pluteus cervinus]
MGTAEVPYSRRWQERSPSGLGGGHDLSSNFGVHFGAHGGDHEFDSDGHHNRHNARHGASAALRVSPSQSVYSFCRDLDYFATCGHNHPTYIALGQIHRAQ